LSRETAIFFLQTLGADSSFKYRQYLRANISKITKQSAKQKRQTETLKRSAKQKRQREASKRSVKEKRQKKTPQETNAETNAKKKHATRSSRMRNKVNVDGAGHRTSAQAHKRVRAQESA
jgi:hypothetical protein